VPRDAADPVSQFAFRLNLALKALNMSRGQLAASVGVDKSLVSRWMSGQVVPTGHNLARISEALARIKPGFNTFAWERPLPEFQVIVGISFEPDIASEPPPPPGMAGAPVTLSPGVVETARIATARRGQAYEGFWDCTRLAFTRPGQFLHDRILIRRREGLLWMRWGNAAYECSGWLLLLAGQLHGILVDDSDDSILFCLLNGVNMPQVDVMDGLFLAIAKDGPQTPSSAACLLERSGQLTGDVAEDDAAYEAFKAEAFLHETDNVPEHVRAHLVRDTGPTAFAEGGDLLLRAPLVRSLSRGSPRD
jgi:transcriptional regulator with XRE-family HTH domain